MTCEDYLALLETLPVEELAYGQAREHSAFCRDCDRVTRVVAERERNMVLAYGELHPLAHGATLVDNAIAAANRRRVAFLYRIGLGVAALATLAFMVVARTRSGALARGRVRETFLVRCLSAEQAAAVLEPAIGPAARIWVRPEAPGVVTVEAPRAAIARAHVYLDELDGAPGAPCAVSWAARAGRAETAVPAAAPVVARPR